MSPGVLFLVPTPIGNLEDITLRAIRILQSVDWIAVEDTRRARVLLSAHSIQRPVIPHHAHNEHQSTPALVARLGRGESGALITDAGMPGISDPGFLLTREARRAGLRVEVLPGPSAVPTALVLAGFPIEPFVFEGYLPATQEKRRRALEALMSEDRTVVLFETPHRVRAALGAMVDVFPERPLAVLREMTKLHEERLVGTAAEVLARLADPVRGEIVIVLAPRGRRGEWTQ